MAEACGLSRSTLRIACFSRFLKFPPSPGTNCRGEGGLAYSVFGLGQDGFQGRPSPVAATYRLEELLGQTAVRRAVRVNNHSPRAGKLPVRPRRLCGQSRPEQTGPFSHSRNGFGVLVGFRDKT